jgi:thiol peroxidase
MASQFKNTSFSDAYGVDMVTGGLAGLMSRAVVVLDENGVVKHTEQVADITSEPDYEKALDALR